MAINSPQIPVGAAPAAAPTGGAGHPPAIKPARRPRKQLSENAFALADDGAGRGLPCGIRPLADAPLRLRQLLRDLTLRRRHRVSSSASRTTRPRSPRRRSRTPPSAPSLYTLIVVHLGVRARPGGRAPVHRTRAALGRVPHRVHVPADDRAGRRRTALAVPAHRQLRHRQRAAVPLGNPVQPGPDSVAERSQHRPVLRVDPRHLADDILHHPRPVRRAAEHPRGRHRGSADRRRHDTRACCSASSSRCCDR